MCRSNRGARRGILPPPPNWKYPIFFHWLCDDFLYKMNKLSEKKKERKKWREDRNCLRELCCNFYRILMATFSIPNIHWKFFACKIIRFEKPWVQESPQLVASKFYWGVAPYSKKFFLVSSRTTFRRFGFSFRLSQYWDQHWPAAAGHFVCISGVGSTIVKILRF